MVSTTKTQLLQLGKVVTSRGTLGPRHSHATPRQMEVAQQILASPHSYSTRIEHCIICVEDRLGPGDKRMLAARLAGGGETLCLQHNFLFNKIDEGSGAHSLPHLSDSVIALRSSKLPWVSSVVFHEDCGAMAIGLDIIHTQLANPHAAGYTLLDRLGLPTPMGARKQIARWAQHVPKGYMDAKRAMDLANKVEPIVGEHNAVGVGVSMKDGEAFVAGPQMKKETNGLLAFGFTPWAARRVGDAFDVSRADRQAATLLGQVFTAEVLLELGGEDLLVAIS